MINFILTLSIISIIIVSVYNFLYPRFIVLFWAEKTLAILEYFIEKAFNQVLITDIEHAQIVEDQLDEEVPKIRKRFFDMLVTMLGPKLSKNCIYVFGSIDGFTTYVTIRFEELFREHGTKVLLSNKRIVQNIEAPKPEN